MKIDTSSVGEVITVGGRTLSLKVILRWTLVYLQYGCCQVEEKILVSLPTVGQAVL